MIEFIPDFPISNLSPADYNPRRIDDESFQILRKSLKTFGVIKPVLLNGNGTLIAGHQRVKALSPTAARPRCPHFRTKLVGLKDEARLNLYHNSVETNASTCVEFATCSPGYHWIQPKQIEVRSSKSPRSSRRSAG
jgi:ParB family chromosome partitioning protein